VGGSLVSHSPSPPTLKLDVADDHNHAKQKLVAKRRKYYAGNESDINEFEESYTAATAPLWYARKTFI
jgi:hypothetical protein